MSARAAAAKVRGLTARGAAGGAPGGTGGTGGGSSPRPPRGRQPGATVAGRGGRGGGRAGGAPAAGAGARLPVPGSGSRCEATCNRSRAWESRPGCGFSGPRERVRGDPGVSPAAGRWVAGAVSGGVVGTRRNPVVSI